MTTATATEEQEKTTSTPRIAHIYCGPCWRAPAPSKALCGHPKTGKGSNPKKPSDICVVCLDIIETGTAICPTCGNGPLRFRPTNKGPAPL